MSPERTATLDPTALDSHPDLVILDAELAQLWEQSAPIDQDKSRRHEQIFQSVLGTALERPGQATDRSIEDGEDNSWVKEEEYSHSTRMIAIVGALAVKEGLQAGEGLLAKETLRERFESSVVEMLHTDREFREKLEINRERRHLVRNGQVMALDGKTAMVGITERGAASANMAAETEKAMEAVAARCSADERAARRVEELPIGGLMVGVSVDPKEAMARYGEKFYEDKGFRKGLAFLQWYYRADENTLLAATYSVDSSDKEIWRDVWREFGSEIPQSEATDTWLDHDISMQCSEEEARKLVLRIRSRFYERRGVTNKRHSVDEFLSVNQSVCDDMFESLYMKLPLAYETKKLDETLKVFVRGLLGGSYSLKKEVREQLAQMQRAENLARGDVALLEQLVRYAVTERLRAGLSLVGGTHVPLVRGFVVPQGIDPGVFIAWGAAAKVLDGAKAGRTYGGCTKSIDLTNSENDPLNPQFAFGGRDSGESQEKEKLVSEDKWGSMTFTCPSCKKENERPVRNRLEPKCLHCFKEIPRCGPAEGNKKETKVAADAGSLIKNLIEGKKSEFILAA